MHHYQTRSYCRVSSLNRNASCIADSSVSACGRCTAAIQIDNENMNRNSGTSRGVGRNSAERAGHIGTDARRAGSGVLGVSAQVRKYRRAISAWSKMRLYRVYAYARRRYRRCFGRSLVFAHQVRRIVSFVVCGACMPFAECRDYSVRSTLPTRAHMARCANIARASAAGTRRHTAN